MLLLLSVAHAFDYNNAGYDDLAITVPGEEGSGKMGMLTFLNGSAGGLVSHSDDYWVEDLCPVGPWERPRRMVGGDVYTNGYDDLIFTTMDIEGYYISVYFLLGGNSGPSACWEVTAPADLGVSAVHLAEGDFNGDGYPDVAWGSAEGVAVAFGPLLDTAATRFGSLTIPAARVISSTAFVPSIVAGDQNNDGYDDLAFTDQTSAGPVVRVYRGTPTGSFTLVRTLTHAGAGNAWGEVLAFGDFNGDGPDDLVVATPYYTSVCTSACASYADAGWLEVYAGAHGGITSTPSAAFSQDTAGVASSSEPGDEFGATLAVIRANGDTRDDLVVGVPYEDYVGSIDGIVHVLMGASGSTLLTGTGSLLLSRHNSGVEGDPTDAGLFGRTLAVADWNGDTIDDLAIGSWTGVEYGSGEVNVLYGTGTTFSTSNDQRWDQDSSGVTGVPEDADGFGYALQ